MSTTRDQQRAILELWEILLRHRWRFVVPAFLVATAVLCAGFMLPRKYRATAIFERRTDMVLSEMSNRGATRAFTDPRQSLAEEIAGQPAVETLLTGLDAELRERGVLRNEIDRRLLHEDIWRHVSVTWDIASAELDRARVEYTGADPELAEIVVNGLVTNYIARTRASMEQRLTRSAAFFRDEAAGYRERIEKLENQILDYEITHGELLPETPNNIQDKIAALQDSIQEAISLRDAATMRVQTIQQALNETPAEVPTVVRSRNPEIAELEKQLANLRKQLHQYTIELRMTESHPDVQQVHSQIEAAEQTLAGADAEIVTERQLGANPKRQELELQLTQATGEQRAYSDRVAALKKQIAELDAATGTLFEVRSTHRKLNRERDEAQRQLAFWEDNLRRVQMALTAESGNRGVQLEFLQPASASRRPVSPSLAQLLMAAAMLGLTAGAVGVFLAYRNDQTFVDGEELEKALNLPLFGSVSEIVTAQHRRMRRLRHALLYPVNAGAMAAVVLAVTAALYFDLEEPQRFDTFRSQAVAAVFSVTGPNTAQAATEANYIPEPAHDDHAPDADHAEYHATEPAHEAPAPAGHADHPAPEAHETPAPTAEHEPVSAHGDDHPHAGEH